MLDVPGDAQALIDAHGKMAAGEALNRAMDCALVHDDAGEGHWLDVALLVMEIQGHGQGDR
jgi:hypothetical protein